jgi:hypothetical protein
VLTGPFFHHGQNCSVFSIAPPVPSAPVELQTRVPDLKSYPLRLLFLKCSSAVCCVSVWDVWKYML